MTLSFPIFIATLLLLGALCALKDAELRRGRRIFLGPRREKLDRQVVHLAAVIEDVLPHHSRELSKQATHHAAYHTTSLLLRGVQFLERRLSSLIDMIKGRGVVKPHNGSASFYLKDIAEHKRQNGSRRDV